MAVANYEDANGHYPPAYVLGPDGKPWHSWRVLILPYIEESKLSEQYRFDEPWDGPNNHLLAEKMPKIYRFHNRTDPGQITTNYLAVVGPRTMWPGSEPRKRIDITDSQSNTGLIVENRGSGVNWMEPRDLEMETMPMEFNHPFGISSWYKSPAIVTVDGSIHTVPKSVSPETMKAALMVNHGEKSSLADGWQFLPYGRQRENAK